MSAPTYWDYLRLKDLLRRQGGLEDDESQLMPDELHFIVVHQALELWFKLCLREIRLARDHLAEPRVPEETVPYVVHHLRRVSSIVGLALDHFQVMETLTPQDFLAFRDKLIPASGFQSFQMREIEILLGLDESQRIAYAGVDPVEHLRRLAQGSETGRFAWERIERARAEQTLKEALDEWLYRTPVQGSSPSDPADKEVIDRFLGAYLAALAEQSEAKAARLSSALGAPAAEVRAQVQSSLDRSRNFLSAEDVPAERRERARRVRAGVLFIESYRELPLLAWPRLLVDTVVELEEQLVLFRARHARMVERIIGRRIGTGGSSGVEYLDKTTAYRIFDHLWEVRTILLPKEALPTLERPEVYGFAR
jgi:tryptophan 2,3-dioxygenase